jgi:hypothetical protein
VLCRLGCHKSRRVRARGVGPGATDYTEIPKAGAGQLSTVPSLPVALPVASDFADTKDTSRYVFDAEVNQLDIDKKNSKSRRTRNSSFDLRDFSTLDLHVHRGAQQAKALEARKVEKGVTRAEVMNRAASRSLSSGTVKTLTS